MIQQTVMTLLRLHFMEMERYTSGFAIASDCPPQLTPVRSANRLAHRRHFHHQDCTPVHLSTSTRVERDGRVRFATSA